ncbi:MAG: SAVED domain-containing protein [Pseudonocardiaceae bacterium]
MGIVRFRFARWMAALLLAIGTAGSAAFGPELIKSVIPQLGQTWWFLGLLILAIAITAMGLWQRRKAVDLDTVGIVVAAIDPGDEPRGQALYTSARRYSRRAFVASVAPFMERLPVERAAAAERIDSLGDRVNELIGFAEELASSASRLNLVLVMRNAAAFRVGMRLGKQHRKPIVIHHSDADSAFAASRLNDFGSAPDGLISSAVTVDDGSEDHACLLLNLQGHGDATLDRAKQACTALGVGRIVEVRSDRSRLPSDQTTFEGVVQHTLTAWRSYRPSTVVGGSIVMVDGPAVIALVLGAQLGTHPDGPWTPYEFDNATSSYVAFAP